MSLTSASFLRSRIIGGMVDAEILAVHDADRHSAEVAGALSPSHRSFPCPPEATPPFRTAFRPPNPRSIPRLPKLGGAPFCCGASRSRLPPVRREARGPQPLPAPIAIRSNSR